MKFTVEQAIDRALAANRNMLSSYYTVRNSELSVKLAESFFDVRLVPAGSFSSSGGYGSDNTLGFGMTFEKRFPYGTGAGFGPKVYKSGDYYSTELGFTIRQPLLKGFSKDVTLDNVRNSEFSLRSAKRSHYLAKVNTILDTVSASYEVIKQKELVRLNAALSDRTRAHAEGAKAKEKSGLATSMDVYRAEIRLMDFENNLSMAKESYQDAQDRLKTILALPMEQEIEISGTFAIVPVAIGLDEATGIALKNRIDYAGMEDEFQEALRRAAVANHNILPGLDLQFNYSRYKEDDSFSGSSKLDNDRWNLLLVSNTTLPMTSEKTAYLQSLNNVETTRLRLETLKDEITRDVRKQLTALKKLEERIDIRKKQIAQAAGKLALASVKFAHDLADNFDIIEAETELQQAQVNLISTEIDYIIGTYKLRAILGTLLVYEN